MLAPVLLPLVLAGAVCAQTPLRIAVFRSDVTPPLGSPLCGGAVEPAREIADPLSARGIVLLGSARPVVLASVDWLGIAGEGWDEWREALAAAAGTTADRVAVHTVHQHDAPVYNPAAERLLVKFGLSGSLYNTRFAAQALARTADAARSAMKRPLPVTHIATGRAKVDRVASNRRVPGPDGKVKYVRYSACKIPEARAEPEGVIDPYVRVIGFWDASRPLVAITYYATHPQSHYGKGSVSADFPGLARSIREKEMPQVFHMHFNGASGNVTAGKYNDGAPENRPVLAGRLAAGMRSAWEVSARTAITAADVEWRVTGVRLPLAEGLRDAAPYRRRLADSAAAPKARVNAAISLAYIGRQKRADTVLTLLRLGPSRVIGMPGELFVEYQLAAQDLRPGAFVAMAAYGDYGPGYIGTRIAYSQGGYETGPPSRTAPEVEAVLLSALRKLLE